MLPMNLIERNGDTKTTCALVDGKNIQTGNGIMTDWIATGHGSYRKLEPGYFELRWRPAGSSGPARRRRIECTEKEAADFLAEQSADRTRGSAGMATKITWDDGLAMYSERLAAKGVVQRYADDVVRILAELREAAPTLNKIQPLHIQNWLDGVARRLQDENRKGWASTANHYRDMASGFFRYLWRMRKLPMNPVNATFPFTETKHAKRDLQPQEYAAVWKVSEPTVRDLMDFSLITACRCSEMAGALRSAVDARGVWTIPGRKAHDFVKIALPAEIVELVARQPKTDDALIFHAWVQRKPESSRGHGFTPGAPIDRTWWRAVLVNRCSQIKGLVPFSPHVLRHAAATWAREAGIGMDDIQNHLGHSSAQMTENYATRPVSNVCQQAIWKARSKAIQSIGA